MNKKLLAMIVAISILVSIGTAVAPPTVVLPVEWTGQGTEPTNVDCTDPKFGAPGTPGIHWIATGHNKFYPATDYVLTINVSGVTVETATPDNLPIPGSAVHFYTDYYDFDNLEATLTFTGAMNDNANVVISHYCPGEDVEIPEFPTVALPIAAILGLSLIFMRRKE